MPRSCAARARLRVDQCVICNPTPAGSQHAKPTTSMRWRGGKLPRTAGAGCIPHDVCAKCFKTTTQRPDGPAILAELLGQVRNDGVRVRHGQQNARSARDALLGTSVSHQTLKIGDFWCLEANQSWGASSHREGLCIPRDYVYVLRGHSTTPRFDRHSLSRSPGPWRVPARHGPSFPLLDLGYGRRSLTPPSLGCGSYLDLPPPIHWVGRFSADLLRWPPYTRAPGTLRGDSPH